MTTHDLDASVLEDAIELLKELIGELGDRNLAVERMRKERSAGGIVFPEEYIQAALIEHLARSLNRRPIPMTSIDTDASWYDSVDKLDKYWPPLREKLESKLGNTVEGIDRQADAIVSAFANPKWPQFNRQGLVVGYVQSGKTTSFEAVISKAADVGYRFVIVLSGLTDNLRNQTQQRLMRDFAMEKSAWTFLTDEENDFPTGAKPDAVRLLSDKNKRSLAVVKKNKAVLQSLNRYLDGAGAVADGCPILIIDDEADQASINVAPHDKSKISAINKEIRNLVARRKTVYTAYTATPFANILIDPNELEDLYPRDFIFVLDEPKGYFGTKTIFGHEQTETATGGPLNDGIPIIRDIPPEEERFLRPNLKQTKEGWQPELPESLESALRWFIMATSIRRSRGHKAHSSMLIHTSFMTEVHEATLKLVTRTMKSLRNELENEQELIRWRHLWDREIGLGLADQFGYAVPHFDEMIQFATDVFGDVRIVLDNSTSTERLEYNDDPETVIAIGGNTLARGLTLEGLICSYFVRNSSAYDTLLQMGRWFGFRHGYEDLPRIWLTSELHSWFRDLAVIEEELRQEMQTYALQGISPMEYLSRVRKHPAMEITSKAKAQDAREAQATYSGMRIQTFEFPENQPEWYEQNLNATEDFVRALRRRGHKPLKQSNGTYVARNVGVDLVLEFLDSYQFHRSNQGGNDMKSRLKSYIESERDGSLRTWNISFFGQKSDKGSKINLGLTGASETEGELALIARSRLKNSAPGTINIKSLAGSKDRINDVEDRKLLDQVIAEQAREGKSGHDSSLIRARNIVLGESVGHLGIYAIDKESKATTQARSDLNTPTHVIGVGFFFPYATEPGSGYTYMAAPTVDDQVLQHRAYEQQERQEKEG